MTHCSRQFVWVEEVHIFVICLAFHSELTHQSYAPKSSLKTSALQTITRLYHVRQCLALFGLLQEYLGTVHTVCLLGLKRAQPSTISVCSYNPLGQSGYCVHGGFPLHCTLSFTMVLCSAFSHKYQYLDPQYATIVLEEKSFGNSLDRIYSNRNKKYWD